MTNLWIGFCRVYFNAYEEGPFFWSVDDGDTAHEVKCTNVDFDGAGFQTRVKPGKAQPRAWIEIPRAAVWQAADGSILVIEVSRSMRLAA